jgi:ABC-type phosphate transport system ATPase subunit
VEAGQSSGAALAEPGRATTPVVRLEDVHKSFGDNVVLDGIDLTVNAGEALVIIGPSGSGKSTLLRCINLLEPIDSGHIFFEGEEITRKGVRVPAVRQRIGIVFQQFTSARSTISRLPRGASARCRATRRKGTRTSYSNASGSPRRRAAIHISCQGVSSSAWLSLVR